MALEGKKVICWDIDGTLLSTGRAGIYAWEEAVKSLLSTTLDLSVFKSAGLTDIEIAEKILCSADVDADGNSVYQLVKLYEDYLPKSLYRKTGAVFCNVREILTSLENYPNVLSMLLTGNTSSGAKTKLAHYKLDCFFTHGAFSDNTNNRVDVAQKALLKANEVCGKVSTEDLYVVGDTPHDVHCGKMIGAKTVAVATGGYTEDELAKCEPWLLLKQLPEPNQFMSLLGII